MTDPCIVSAHSLSQKEQQLMRKLYSSGKKRTSDATIRPATSGGPGRLAVPSASSERGKEGSNEQGLDRGNGRPSQPERLREPERGRERQPDTADWNQDVDQNLNTFVNEMRQEFAKAQAAAPGGVAQNLLYHQTRMLEKHVGLLEQNQQNVKDLLKTVVEGQGGAGGNKAEKLKYDICNENRRLLQETLAPLHKQIDDVRALYKDNRDTIQELYQNIETIKDIVRAKPHDIDADVDAKYRQYRQNNRQLNGAIATAVTTIDTMGLSSEAYKQEMNKIKEQMQEIQKDSQAIELEMQRRFARILEENERCKLLLATNLQQPVRVGALAASLPGTAAGPDVGASGTRPGLKGQLEDFDYDGLFDALTDTSRDMSEFEKQFKASALALPTTTVGNRNKQPFYDFSVGATGSKSKAGSEPTTTTAKPQYLANIQTKLVTVQSPVFEAAAATPITTIIDRGTRAEAERETAAGRGQGRDREKGRDLAKAKPASSQKPQKTTGTGKGRTTAAPKDRQGQRSQTRGTPQKATRPSEQKSESREPKSNQQLRLEALAETKPTQYAHNIPIKEYIDQQERQRIAAALDSEHNAPPSPPRVDIPARTGTGTGTGTQALANAGTGRGQPHIGSAEAEAEGLGPGPSADWKQPFAMKDSAAFRREENSVSVVPRLAEVPATKKAPASLESVLADMLLEQLKGDKRAHKPHEQVQETALGGWESRVRVEEEQKHRLIARTQVTVASIEQEQQFRREGRSSQRVAAPAMDTVQERQLAKEPTRDRRKLETEEPASHRTEVLGQIRENAAKNEEYKADFEAPDSDRKELPNEDKEAKAAPEMQRQSQKEEKIADLSTPGGPADVEEGEVQSDIAPHYEVDSINFPSADVPNTVPYAKSGLHAKPPANRPKSSTPARAPTAAEAEAAANDKQEPKPDLPNVDAETTSFDAPANARSFKAGPKDSRQRHALPQVEPQPERQVRAEVKGPPQLQSQLQSQIQFQPQAQAQPRRGVGETRGANISSNMNTNTNAYVYVKRSNDVQELPHQHLAVQPRPKEPPKLEERVPIETLKLDTEAEILKRHIPINVEPLIAGLLEPPTVTPGVPYSNPFDLQRAYADLQIPPPIVVNMDDYDLSSTSFAPSEVLEHREVIGADSSISSTSLHPDTPIGASASLRHRPMPYPGTQSASEATSLSEGEVRLGQRAAYEEVKASAKSRVNFDSPSSGYVTESVSGISQGQLEDIDRRHRERFFNAADSTFSEGEVPGGQRGNPPAQPLFEDNLESGPQPARGGRMERPRAREPVNISQASFGAEGQKGNLYLNLSEHNPDNEAAPPGIDHFKP